MAYNRRNLSGNIGGGSGSLKVFTFQDTASTKAQIAAADYFLDAYQILSTNDIILAGGSDGSVVLAVVLSTSATVTTEEATLL